MLNIFRNVTVTLLWCFSLQSIELSQLLLAGYLVLCFRQKTWRHW